MSDAPQLTGRRIIVVGAASGMGAASVRAFVSHGARVVAMDVDDARAQALLAAVTGPGHVSYRHCEIRDRASVQAAFSSAVTELGGLDVLAHSAAIERGADADALTDEQWDEMLDVNAKGTLHTNQTAFPALRDGGGGSIINFGSVSGVRGSAHAAHYAASKGAVIAWTRSIAVAWAPYGIRVNALAPAIWTEMYDLRRERLRTPEEVEAHDREKAAVIPLGGKLGDPDRDFAPVMVFLAGEGARFITGQILPVDGGMLMVR